MLKFWLTVFTTLTMALPTYAADYTLTLKDHQFSPKELTIPIHEKIKLTIKNLDTAPAEFESSELNREKIVGAGSEAILYIGPLPAGNYHYFNDFDHAASGIITVK